MSQRRVVADDRFAKAQNRHSHHLASRDVAHACHLYTIGVTDAVPETIEASLQLSEASLIRLGQDTGLVIAPIHEKRDDFAMSCSAAEQAGLETTRSIRAKTRRSS